MTFRITAFERQQQRAERPRQQDERDDRDQRRSSAGSCRRPASMKSSFWAARPPTRDVGAGRVRGVAHLASQRRGRLRRAAVGDGEGRRSTCGARARSRRPGRRDGAVDAVDARDVARTTASPRVAARRGSRTGSSAPGPMPESSSAIRPTLASPYFASVSGFETPELEVRGRDDEQRRGSRPRRSPRPSGGGRRAPPSASRPREALSSVRDAASRAWARASEHDGQQRQRDEHADERDQHAAVADGAQEGQRQRDEREQADRHGRAAEDDGAARGLHRAHDRLVALEAVRALLAPAHDDDQRVVDRDAEPDQRDQELHDRRDVGERGQPVGDAGTRS